MEKFSKASKKHPVDKMRDNSDPVWVKQEKDAAKTFNGKRTIGSGNKPMHKGDIKSKTFLVEAKSTTSRSWTFKAEWLEKISDEAMGYSRVPAMHLHFDDVRSDCEKRWVLLPESFFKKMMEDFDGFGLNSDDGQ